MKDRLIDMWFERREDRERIEAILWTRYGYDLGLKFPFNS